MQHRKDAYFYAFSISFVMFSCVYAQYQLSPIGDEIMKLYDLNRVQFSSLFAAPMIPAIFLSIPAGMLIDRIGVRSVLLTASAVSVLGLSLRMVLSSYPGVYLSMILSGVAIAVINAAIAKIVSVRIPLKEVNRVVGLILAGDSLGMVVGMATTPLLPGVSFAFGLSLFFMVLASILLYISLKDLPHSVKAADKRTDNATFSSAIVQVFRSRNIWLTGFVLALVMALNIFLGSQLPTALQSTGLGVETSSLVSSFMLIGFLVGAALGPQFFRLFRHFRFFAVFMSALAGLGGAFAWQIENLPLLSLALFLTGFAIGGFIPILMSLPVYIKEIGEKLAGIGGGLIATCQLLGAVVIPTYVVLPLAGDQLHVAFYMAAFCAVLAACGALFIKADL